VNVTDLKSVVGQIQTLVVESFHLYITMTQSTAGTIISWVAFIFLIFIGLEASIRFTGKFRSRRETESSEYFEYGLRRRLRYTFSFGTCIFFAVLVLISKPFSTEWTILVAISYIFILTVVARRLFTKDAK
jgi:hypothetical protein